MRLGRVQEALDSFEVKHAAQIVHVCRVVGGTGLVGAGVSIEMGLPVAGTCLLLHSANIIRAAQLLKADYTQSLTL